MSETKLEFNSILEARKVLETLKSTNKIKLKKNPNLYEDYDILINCTTFKCKLKYFILDKSQVICNEK